LPKGPCDPLYLAVRGADRQWRLLRRQTLDHCFDFYRYRPASAGGSPIPQAQRLVPLQVWYEQTKPIQRELPDCFREPP